MTEHPIIFPATMVRALLAGTKTQTRRVLRGKPDTDDIRYDPDSGEWYCERGTWHQRRAWSTGDRLWVRESFFGGHAGVPNIVYRASCVDERGFKWRPSIHMPRWASRITLAVEAVRVERLQDITEGDAIAEGMVWRATTPEDIAKDHEYCRKIGVQPHKYLGDGAWTVPGVAGPNDGPWGTTAREAFCALWGTIHGPDAWNDNPWVSVTTFRREAP